MDWRQGCSGGRSGADGGRALLARRGWARLRRGLLQDAGMHIAGDGGAGESKRGWDSERPQPPTITTPLQGPGGAACIAALAHGA